jgi:pimeloyl-ACP methyl ester carboxylesterase
MKHVSSVGAPSRALLYTEPSRAAVEFGTFLTTVPLLRRAPQGDGHTVLVLPGFLADDRSTLVLRNYLGSLGHHTYGWGLGRNIGPTAEVMEGMRAQLARLADSSGAPVSLVGWSLGGMFARSLAHELPEQIRDIVTLGSPFRSDSPIGSHAARSFERFAHRHVPDTELPAIDVDRGQLSMPVTAIYTKADGVVAWQTCLQEDGVLRENVEVPGSHCGLGHNPAALWVVADRLAQPVVPWAPFASPSYARHLYPTPAPGSMAA